MIFIQPSIVNGGNTLDHVQTDMDSRYNVSGSVRTFADGAVLPPLDDIQEKGSPRGNTRIPAAVPVQEKGDNASFIRPFRRR